MKGALTPETVAERPPSFCRVSSTATTPRLILSGSIWPMQPMRKLSTTVSLPG
ncbi:hypothetical protein [Rhodobacter capsulatus]|uniref:hypothetical protein n=1 Tax=Rhodobacter capsulatus TaxID=1061 RepID=UPI0003D38831|nr:hypothetical protein [Rhodobacter capsulatus]ETD80698.1 hypothetical protein U716_13330 [Rhodobacter capsulatus B6]